MSTIPPNLNDTFKNLQGFRKNLIRFYADRSGSINANDVLRWTFPKEIINIETLMAYFEVSTKRSGSQGSTYRGSYFPRNSASIIDTLTVYINGQVFENITNYNHLFNLIYDNTCGFNYYQSGIRALECTDPSIVYSVADATGNTITATVQGTVNSATADDAKNVGAFDYQRPLQIRNWIGFLGTANKILDLRNVELVVEIRYASGNILIKGVDTATASTAIAPTYVIDKYYMTVQKFVFDDDNYSNALIALKNSGNYTIAFKTFSSARGASSTKTNNPTLQFSTTAKYLSKLYFTMLDGTYDTPTTILNTTNTNSFSQHLADLKTNVTAFNQSKFFQKNAVSLTDVMLEINGLPVYPFNQPLHLIKNNNFDALDLEGDNYCGDFVGLQSLESWTKYGFLMATSFEWPRAWKNGIISGYPNPTSNLLNIKYSTNFNSSAASDNVFLLGFAEKIVKCNFEGGAVTIDY